MRKQCFIGVIEDKVARIRNKTYGTLYDQLSVKTCGMIDENKELGVRTFAKPIGVVANVVPCTNPESTVCCLALGTLKTRNAMIVSPHPRTQNCSYGTVQHVRKGLATGGAAIAKIVYAAGKPSQTVGAGNVVSIVDKSANLETAAKNIRISKIANNAASCSSENAVAIEESAYDKMITALINEGGYMCSTEEREKVRQCLWPDGVHLNRDIVAKSAPVVAEMVGITVPENTKILLVIG